LPNSRELAGFIDGCPVSAETIPSGMGVLASRSLGLEFPFLAGMIVPTETRQMSGCVPYSPSIFC
jgi:hypothetical protein